MVVVNILLLFVLDSDLQLNKLGLEGGGGESGCKGEGKKVSNSLCIRERACSKKEDEVGADGARTVSKEVRVGHHQIVQTLLKPDKGISIWQRTTDVTSHVMTSFALVMHIYSQDHRSLITYPMLC